MKHLLNNLSEEEKNSIREKHTGGMKVVNETFSKLINSKLGNVKPLVTEQHNDTLINDIIKMDAELERDPMYKKYEKKYAMKKLKDTMVMTMGMDESEIPDEMIEMMMGLASEMSKLKLTPEIVMSHKDSVINTCETIMDMAQKDNQTELISKLEKFISLLNQL